MRERRRRQPACWAFASCFAAAVIGLAGCTGPPHDPALPGSSAAGPTSQTSPPVRICGNHALLGRGPSSPPQGAVTIPAGDNSGFDWGRAKTTYWFAPGTHTLGTGGFDQIIPANDDTFIGAPGAILDGRGDNHYAFTGGASNVTIKYLTIQDFGIGSSAATPSGDNAGQGVVNHDAGRGWVMQYLTVQYNAGAGVFVGTDGNLSYSCLRDNGEYGFQGQGSDAGRFSGTNLTIDHNEVAGNNTWNWESKDGGCGCSGADKFWNVANVKLTDNYIHNNHGPGIWADTDNANFDVENNYVSGNDGEGVIYEISYNLRLAHNIFVRNALTEGPALGGFPDSAVYISESGGDSRVPHSYGAAIDIFDNRFIDNWGGVVLWENANRYCGTGANTSTGYCTLVDPPVATVKNCGNPRLIGARPYVSDCRWETKNVVVRENYFNFNPANIGPKCTVANYCGFNGIFSEWGSWQPYKGAIVENHITFDQNNHFMSNIYDGPWRFVAHEQGNVVGWSGWRGSPYNQDRGSVLKR
jgi:hypothetical protein